MVLWTNQHIPIPDGCHGKPASWQAINQPAQPTCWIAGDFARKSNFTLCLIKDIIMRYEEGDEIGIKIQKQHGGHQEYETK
jgi:hypothetical protein